MAKAKREMQEYILKGEKVYIGLEDSKKKWTICVRSDSLIVHETTMPARYEVLHSYLENRFPECQVRVMYEAGFRGFELHDQLTSDGFDCIVTPPHTLTEEKCNRKKNERHDARRLAKNNENEDFKACHVPDRALREDRQVSRLYGKIQADIVRVRNRIRKALEYHGLDVDLPPGKWQSRHYGELEEFLKGKNLGRSLAFTFKTMLEQLEYLRNQKREILKELRRISREERYRESVHILKSAPGIGLLTAVRLTLEWGDVSRFKSKGKWGAFGGLIPSEYSTGEQDHKGHITKQGNQQVRSWLIESAWRAIGRDPVLMNKYKRVLRSSGSKKKAIVAVAHKLQVRLRTILLTGEPYVIGLAK